MPFLDDELNAQADDAAGRAVTVHLHDGDPGVTGLDNELTGGGYVGVDPGFLAGGLEGPLGASDQPATPGVAWGAPAFDVPDATVTYWSLRDATDCLGYWPVTETPVEAGVFTPNIAVGPGV